MPLTLEQQPQSGQMNPTNPQKKTIPPQTQTPTTTASPKFEGITKLPSFAARGTAIAKRLEAVKADPKYQKLDPQKQASVRADLYKKYVPFSYAGFHLPVPDEKTWVEASGRELNVAGKDIFTTKKLSESYKDTKGQQLGEDFYAGVDKAYSNMTVFGLDSHYSHKDDSAMPYAAAMRDTAKQVQRTLQNTEDAYRSRVQSDDFWLQTHPRDTVIGRLSSDAGGLVATLPLYEALGAEGASGAAARVAGKYIPVTARLATTPVGKFVAKRLINATGTYMAALGATGGDADAAKNFAIMDAVIGAYGEAQGGAFKAGKMLRNNPYEVGNILGKIASAPLIKKWTANTIAMG